MDYHHNQKESWQWHGDDYYIQKDTDVDVQKCVWGGVTQNEEDISYMFEETTPVKASGDFIYHYDDSDIVTKTPQEYKEFSSQVKRRRMLDFDDSNEDFSLSFLKSKERIDGADVIPPEVSQWEACLQGFEELTQSEAWLAECLNDTEMSIGSDERNASASSDVQISITDVCKITPDEASNTVQRPVRSSRNIVFKGRKSFMRTPTKLASSVAYPFDFVKPCGVSGDVTLKDINHRILTPLQSKSKQVNDERPICYPTSAISGKPVIGKTKIPTQGGKGSITITRTKG